MFMEELLNKCEICPRKCKVNRNNGELGYCKASNKMKIGGYHLHMWEEPIITGKNGSGTIFFSYCNLRCAYCQNYDLSFDSVGEYITIERLSDIMLELQEMQAENVNLVTPTHYIPLIKNSIVLAKEKGLKIPIVYNTSGYESVESLKTLEGLIDIYLPDFKYYDNSLGKYSSVADYFNITSLALKEMYRQVGKPKYNKKGMLKKGVIVRHLVLPNNYQDSKKIINYLYQEYKDNIILSIMNQYTITKITKYPELNQKVDPKEYDNLIDYAYNLGIRNCFTQEEESQSESFIPKFKGDTII
ncbi:MAG: radical SAM protein [Firmicutes bacterium]|nr:radical SAM protein [Bacillota bacterium]OLA34100.1 MAG: radical SAM protein [Firmicutes bacterium CAG:321_26_22]